MKVSIPSIDLHTAVSWAAAGLNVRDEKAVVLLELNTEGLSSIVRDDSTSRTVSPIHNLTFIDSGDNSSVSVALSPPEFHKIAGILRPSGGDVEISVNGDSTECAFFFDSFRISVPVVEPRKIQEVEKAYIGDLSASDFAAAVETLAKIADEESNMISVSSLNILVNSGDTPELTLISTNRYVMAQRTVPITNLEEGCDIEGVLLPARSNILSTRLVGGETGMRMFAVKDKSGGVLRFGYDLSDGRSAMHFTAGGANGVDDIKRIGAIITKALETDRETLIVDFAELNQSRGVIEKMTSDDKDPFLLKITSDDLVISDSVKKNSRSIPCNETTYSGVPATVPMNRLVMKKTGVSMASRYVAIKWSKSVNTLVFVAVNENDGKFEEDMSAITVSITNSWQ